MFYALGTLAILGIGLVVVLEAFGFGSSSGSGTDTSASGEPDASSNDGSGQASYDAQTSLTYSPGSDATSGGFSDAGASAGLSMINPQDQSTWPTGDKIWNVCQAIALAEGYGPPENNPTRLHNPGDISDYAETYGYETHSGSKVTSFPDDETGWTSLYNKVWNIVNGNSTVYRASWSWDKIAQKYSGNWQAWVNNVTSYLGVSPSDVFADYFK